MRVSNATIAITALLAAWNAMVAARTGYEAAAWVSGLLLVALGLLIAARTWDLLEGRMKR